MLPFRSPFPSDRPGPPFRGPLEASEGSRIGGKVVLLALKQTEELLHVSGDDQAGEVCTLALALQESGSVKTATPAQVSAAIDFGSGGSSQRVYVSVRRGTQLSIPASAVRVQVTLDAYITDGSPVPPVTVLGHIAYGSRSGLPGGNAPTLDGNRTFAGAVSTSASILLPPFAHAATVVPNLAAGFYATTIVQLTDILGNVLVEYVGSAWPGYRHLPLPAGAYAMRLVNTGAGPFTFTPLFELSL